MKKKLNVLGMDPALRNWGYAFAKYTVNTGNFEVLRTHTVLTKKDHTKSVRNNSKDLVAAIKQADYLFEAVKKADVIFVEIPHGSQSARAMAGYGICLGLLSALHNQNRPFIQLTEREIKIAVTGRSSASKQAVIDWAVKEHPNVVWQKTNGVIKVPKNEHVADAIGAIEAGLQTDEFSHLLRLQGLN